MTHTSTIRYLLCITTIVAAFASLASAQQAEAVRWRTGEMSSTVMSRTDINATLKGAAVSKSYSHLVVQFDRAPEKSDRDKLEAAGMTLLSPLGSNAFFASIDRSQADISRLAATRSLTLVSQIDTRWKLHPTLDRQEVSSWSVVAESEEGQKIVAVLVLFHRDVDVERSGVDVVYRHDATVKSITRSINGLIIELPFEKIADLAAEDAVSWIEPPLPAMEDLNNSNRAITGANTVQESPYDLSGAGVSVMVYDGGTAWAEHTDFNGRLTVRDNAGVSDHATHVSGTIGGNGAQSFGVYRGMAPEVTIESFGLQDAGYGFLYTDTGDIEDDYETAIHTYGVDLANNSIGTNTAPNGLPCEWTGDYGATAQLIDTIVRGDSSNPVFDEPFRVIWSAGNERSSIRCGTGYSTTAPPSAAKNQLCIGGLNSNDDSMTNFTSWGPTDDGRLRPDFCGPGCQSSDDWNVTSCYISSPFYTGMCGTSMSAPTVTGLAALLLEDYRVQYPNRDDPRNSTLKVLFAHTAVDVQQTGPDYKTGYGSVRIVPAIDLMRSGSFLEDSVDHGDTYIVLMSIPGGTSELKVTLAWDDYPGTPNVIPSLVNDLDLRVYDPSETRHYPWTLNPSQPDNSAVRTQEDHLNNIEQVYVTSPAAGLWRVEIHGYNVAEGPQPFSVCGTPILSLDCDQNGEPDDEQILADPSLDCGGDGILDACEPDCDNDGTADSCEILAGTSDDCNSNLIPDECEPDCNGNGSADDCDVIGGSSEDCNGDLIPDECSTDCNGNEVWDVCEIFSGSSYDCNLNDLPDECEGFTEGPRVYVSSMARGRGDGTDWDDAMPNLYTAICLANHNPAITEIWVADGEYAPSKVGGSLTSTFEIADGLKVYGGFAGWETSLDQRNLSENTTILTGDLGRNDMPGFVEREDNSYHVVTCVDAGSSTLLDGLVITAGYAHGSSPHNKGGGVLLDSSSVVIRNCTILANSAFGSGGGVVSFGGGQPVFENCLIDGNVSSFVGGGISNESGSVEMVGCTMVSNSTTNWGGGLYNNWSGTAQLTNSIFWDNADGGGQDESAQVHGGTVTADYCCIRALSSIAGTGSISDDPLFEDNDGPDHDIGTLDDDLRLKAGSPCVNAGDVSTQPQVGLTDLDGHHRVMCSRIDIGAYERHVGDYECDDDVDLDDYAQWGTCVTGPGGVANLSICSSLDTNGDGDVDLADFANVQSMIEGQ